MTRFAILYPSRLTITPERTPKTAYDILCRSVDKHFRALEKQQYTENFKQKGNPFILSPASKRKLFDSINSMFHLSPKRNIEMKNGKTLYNFKCNFITLTLPSSQVHPDKFIKSNCLNHLLVELRKFYKVENYVWKAELQQNESIHFHLITDQYIDYQALRRRWNRILDKHGYIEKYAEKFRDMSLSEYHDYRNKFKSCDFKTTSNAYAMGKKYNWRNPNSVDVRSVNNKKDLACYLSKYITKDVKKDQITEELTERQKTFGRSWTRSYSLAKLKYQNKFTLNEITNLIAYFKSIPKKVRECIGEWSTVFYFNASNLSVEFQKWHLLILKANASFYNYPIPAT